ncbi:MAG: AAA family ATPase [Oscillospiraceae bacterium]|nr:AAA family ATPase [Oscillospiraceae bacterium]
MNDYLKFKKLLAWFVNQLNINNDITDGDKVTGRGYSDNSSLRKYYADCRSYDGFELDCTIDHKYGNYATTSNYINLAGTDFNAIPEFDKTSKAVISLYIGNHPPQSPIDRKSESISVASLGLGDDEPNQALRNFFDMFKQKILEYKNNLATTIEYSEESLGQILRNMYDSAGKGEKVLKIHLFGIEYGHTITSNSIKVSGIVSKAGLNPSYVTEVSKGISIGAELQKNNETFSPEPATAISLKEFAIKVLEDTLYPMTDVEIWEYGVDKGWDERLNSVGKTPWQSIYAMLSNYKDGVPNPDKRINIIESEQRRKFVINSIDGEEVVEHENTLEFDYNIGISKDQWTEMLENSVITEKDVDLLRKWLYFEGTATCTEVGKAYNAHPSAYIMPVVSMARRIHDYTSCKTRLDKKGDIAWWNIPFTGRYINGGEYFEWTIRPEFYEALVSKGITSLFPTHLTKGLPIKTKSVISPDPYTEADFFAEVYFDKNQYDDIVALLTRKKNIILQGAPGVGKSYMAKRFAYSIVGAKDERKVEMIQFHQNYSYEDFIEGFRPNASGSFELKQGVFYNFCVKAQKDIESKYFFIIDEINRGNLSKVMGELMLLLEHDKRGEEFAMKLTYSSELFYVPQNVFIIGMMNTADRSLAMIDYALRRRFSFIPVEPIFDNLQFVADFKNNYPEAEAIIEKIKKLNSFISENLDSGHQIGHSYFCSKSPFSTKDIDGIIKYEIEELLNEYFFDDKDNLEKAKDLLK